MRTVILTGATVDKIFEFITEKADTLEYGALYVSIQCFYLIHKATLRELGNQLLEKFKTIRDDVTIDFCAKDVNGISCVAFQFGPIGECPCIGVMLEDQSGPLLLTTLQHTPAADKPGAENTMFIY
jgi:hypothetical protein